MNKKIGLSVKNIRQANGISRKELADLLGCSVYAIEKYEQGQRKIPFEILSKIANIFNVPLDSLLPPGYTTNGLIDGVVAFGLGKTISFSDMINSLDDPFLGRSKQENINMCEYASKILEASNIKITCVKDKEFDYLIHIMNYSTGKATFMQYDQFFVEAEKITWFMKNEISTIMEAK